MRWSLLTSIAAALAAVTGFGSAHANEVTRISGPVVHENLAIYFIHGKSVDGKVPLTLAEAMAKGVVLVRETGNVNQLEVENTGQDEVFIQSGDIVKGGKQDRTLMVSLVLPPKSGRIPIASFCVEQGRWSARDREDPSKFSSATASIPSRKMKLALQAPMKAPEPTAPGNARPSAPNPAYEVGARQQRVWDGVREAQQALAGSLKADVRSAKSASSLQLALESDKLVAAQKAYTDALKAAAEKSDDIIGFVFAISGKLNSADVYTSNGLFRKMWPKLLNASVVEAISHKHEKAEALPTVEAVTAFLADADKGKSTERPLNTGVKLDTREGEQAYLFETARADRWVHRNYLAK
jgi:hypothetical protein